MEARARVHLSSPLLVAKCEPCPCVTRSAAPLWLVSACSPMGAPSWRQPRRSGSRAPGPAGPPPSPRPARGGPARFAAASAGLADLIRAALAASPRSLLIGLGDTGTVDGGDGLLRELAS